jgi:hypothetical protein
LLLRGAKVLLATGGGSAASAKGGGTEVCPLGLFC